MGKYFDMLMEDVRMKEGLHACMNCGVCTGVCPAAEFYNYDPRQIVCIVQTRDDDAIEELLKSDTIWYCGECMSCRPRCPRGNTPGYVIQALRTLSQKLGFFVESEKGRQQLALKRIIGDEQLFSMHRDFQNLHRVHRNLPIRNDFGPHQLHRRLHPSETYRNNRGNHEFHLVRSNQNAHEGFDLHENMPSSSPVPTIHKFHSSNCLPKPP